MEKKTTTSLYTRCRKCARELKPSTGRFEKAFCPRCMAEEEYWAASKVYYNQPGSKKPWVMI